MRKLFIPIVIGIVLTSCKCNCDCYKEPGCKIMTAKRTSDGAIVEIVKYCSETSVDFDRVMHDSVRAFHERHGYGGYTVSQSDSIAPGGQRKMNQSCNEGQRHEENGFQCVYAK